MADGMIGLPLMERKSNRPGISYQLTGPEINQQAEMIVCKAGIDVNLPNAKSPAFISLSAPEQRSGNLPKDKDLHFEDEREPQNIYFDIQLDDAGLTPYEYRVYGRIARRCSGKRAGFCKESGANMATGCQMSRAQVFRALKGLIDRHMIRMAHSSHGDTSVYVLTDKSSWKQPVSTGDAPVSTSDGVVSDRDTHPSPSETHEEDTLKKTNKETKKEDSLPVSPSAPQAAGADQPKRGGRAKAKKDGTPKSLFHSHPTVVSYREILGFRAVNAEQASMIAAAVGADLKESPTDWVQFLREHAARGAKYAANVPVILAAFGHYRGGALHQQAMERAWDQEKGINNQAGGQTNGANQPKFETRMQREERRAKDFLADLGFDVEPGGGRGEAPALGDGSFIDI